MPIPLNALRSPVLAVALALSAAMALSSPAPVAAAELDGAAVLAGIQRWLDGTRDLSGRFVQQLDSGALGSGLSESGRIYVRRPGSMRWEYEDPERKVALVLGRETTLYIEEDGELFLGRLDGDGDLLSTLLLGDGALGDVFSAELLATPTRGGEGAYRIQLDPRIRADTVEHVVLTVRPPLFALERAEVLDSLGNRVSYGFIDLKRNRGVSPEMFVFEAPAGTRVSGSH